MKFILIFILVFLISSVSGICQDGQVDINTASLEELDQLYGIGPVKAQAIIDTRTFNTVDDLIDVKGIAEKTLENIKSQNLACVGNGVKKEEVEENIKDIIEEGSIDETVSKKIELEGIIEQESNYPEETTETSEPQIIRLTPKTIKSEESSENLDKNDFVTWGLVAFSILLAFLFGIKYLNSRLKENELA